MIRKILDFFLRSRITATHEIFFVLLLPLFFGTITVKILLRILLLFLFEYHVFLYNDYCDKEDDKKSPSKKKRNLFCAPSNSFQHKSAEFLMHGIIISAIMLSFLFDKTFLPYLFLGFFLDFIYSYPGIRVRNITALDIIWHGTWALYVALPFIIDASKLQNTMKPIIIIAVFVAGTMGQLINQLRDYDADKKSRSKNTSQTLGKKNSARLLAADFILLNTIVGIILFRMHEYYSIFALLIFGAFVLIKLHITEKSFRIFYILMGSIIFLNYLFF